MEWFKNLFRQKNTHWKTAYFCVKCDGQITYYIKMDNHGRCPLCGYKHPDACTIVETYEKACRYLNYKKEYINVNTIREKE